MEKHSTNEFRISIWSFIAGVSLANFVSFLWAYPNRENHIDLYWLMFYLLLTLFIYASIRAYKYYKRLNIYFSRLLTPEEKAISYRAQKRAILYQGVTKGIITGKQVEEWLE